MCFEDNCEVARCFDAGPQRHLVTQPISVIFSGNVVIHAVSECRFATNDGKLTPSHL